MTIFDIKVYFDTICPWVSAWYPASRGSDLRIAVLHRAQNLRKSHRPVSKDLPWRLIRRIHLHISAILSQPKRPRRRDPMDAESSGEERRGARQRHPDTTPAGRPRQRHRVQLRQQDWQDERFAPISSTCASGASQGAGRGDLPVAL